MAQVHPAPVLVSAAFDDIPAPDHADVVVVPLPASLDPVPDDPAFWAAQVFSVGSAPAWVRGLFGLRAALVGLVGIPQGSADAFAVAEVRGQEAVIRTDDVHLDFRAAVGIDVGRRLLRVTTVVRLHGLRGRLYWLPVSVLHGPVTRAMMARAVASAAGTGRGA